MVSPLDAVAKLMDERSKYEAFLRELDKGGSSKPPHVVAKVRADYTAKLQGVVERLNANHGDLTRHSETLHARLTELEGAEQKIVDEQTEADLRKQVGELSPSDWSAASKKAEAALMKIKQEQQVVAADLNRIRDIIGGVSAAESVAKPATVDELAFLKSVVGASTGPVPLPAIPSAPQRTTSKTTPARPTGESPKPESASSAKTLPSGTKAVPRPSKSASPTDVGGGRKTKEAATAPAPDPVPAPSSGIKCKSCGASNPRNVWYCQKCGMELVLV